MLNRREFHGALAAMLAAATMPASAKPSSSDRFINRLSFGATPKLRQSFGILGLEAWLDQQLTTRPDPEILKRLSETKLRIEYEAGTENGKQVWKARKEEIPLQYLDTPSAQLVKFLDFEKLKTGFEERIRPTREVQAASLIRAVHAEYQLHELITHFWHDHFNVNATRDEKTAVFFADYDKIIRGNAFGNFRKFLGDVTQSPSMLYYLNNDASRASPANENFARELFELHTFGAENYLNDKTTSWKDVPGATEGNAQGYIDQDVYEAARALTGWSVGDGRYIDDGENAPATGVFHYIDRWHDPYQKRILGVEFKANQGPMVDGNALLDLVAFHPLTANYICKKLCRRLLTDDPPPSLIDKAAGVWLREKDASDQIAKTIKAIVMSSEFSDEQPPKLKRPFEFMVSYLRATGADASPRTQSHTYLLSRAGYFLHEYRPPTGHPDVSEHWASTSTLASYTDYALYLLEDWNELAKIDFDKAVSKDIKTFSDAVQHVMQTFTGQKISHDDISILAKSINLEDNAPWPENGEERKGLTQMLFAFAALQPAFLYR